MHRKIACVLFQCVSLKFGGCFFNKLKPFLALHSSKNLRIAELFLLHFHIIIWHKMTFCNRNLTNQVHNFWCQIFKWPACSTFSTIILNWKPDDMKLLQSSFNLISALSEVTIGLKLQDQNSFFFQNVFKVRYKRNCQ